MNRILGTVAVLGLAIFTQSARASNLSELALLSRCYGHLTGHPLPISNTYRTKINNGSMTAIGACEDLLDKAQLGSDGYLSNRNDSEAQSVLRNFNNFHRTWFPGNAVENIQEYGEETSRGTQDIYDSTEPGLAITRAVFGQNAKYQDIVTISTGVHALRAENSTTKNFIGWNVTIPSRRIYGNNSGLDQNLFHFAPYAVGFDGNSDTTNSMFANLPKIEVGELIGIRLTTESATIPNVSLYPLGPVVPGHTQASLNYSFNLYQTLGGGILGSPIYIMMNYGHGRGTMANGSTKVPRRWSQTNMQSLMCANLPALRESDVAQYLVGNSSAPFRNATSCLRCHANLDPMAYTVRNVITAGTDYAEFNTGSRGHAKAALVMASYRADIGSVSGWPSEPVTNFHRQTPTGRLYFRSFASGALINKSVNNVTELGYAMASTDDFYQCAAKRYFSFFTGINVSMYDRTDPANSTLNQNLTETDLKDRQFIESLALTLKQTQSVRSMVKKILESDYYRSADGR